LNDLIKEASILVFHLVPVLAASQGLTTEAIETAEVLFVPCGSFSGLCLLLLFLCLLDGRGLCSCRKVRVGIGRPAGA
jgi:hypothetical protein